MALPFFLTWAARAFIIEDMPFVIETGVLMVFPGALYVLSSLCLAGKCFLVGRRLWDEAGAGKKDERIDSQRSHSKGTVCTATAASSPDSPRVYSKGTASTAASSPSPSSADNNYGAV